MPRKRKVYRVVSEYMGGTALAGYRHTLRGARLLLKQIQSGPGSKNLLRIEVQEPHELTWTLREMANEDE